MNHDGSLIEWTAQRIAAIGIALFAVLLTWLTTSNIELTAKKGFVLLLPLSVIFWPEVIESMHRKQGFYRLGGELAPAPILQVVAWIVLLTLGFWHLLLPWFVPIN